MAGEWAGGQRVRETEKDAKDSNPETICRSPRQRVREKKWHGDHKNYGTQYNFRKHKRNNNSRNHIHTHTHIHGGWEKDTRGPFEDCISRFRSDFRFGLDVCTEFGQMAASAKQASGTFAKFPLNDDNKTSAWTLFNAHSLTLLVLCVHDTMCFSSGGKVCV